MVMFYECMGLEFVLLHVIQGSLSILLFVRGGENEVFGRPCLYPGNVAGGTLAFSYGPIAI